MAKYTLYDNPLAFFPSRARLALVEAKVGRGAAPGPRAPGPPAAGATVTCAAAPRAPAAPPSVRTPRASPLDSGRF